MRWSSVADPHATPYRVCPAGGGVCDCKDLGICETEQNLAREQHVVKVVFRDFVPVNHMRDLIRHIEAEFGMEVVEECEWRDPEGGITLTIYPEPDSNG